VSAVVARIAAGGRIAEPFPLVLFAATVAAIGSSTLGLVPTMQPAFHAAQHITATGIGQYHAGHQDHCQPTLTHRSPPISKALAQQTQARTLEALLRGSIGQPSLQNRENRYNRQSLTDGRLSRFAGKRGCLRRPSNPMRLRGMIPGAIPPLEGNFAFFSKNGPAPKAQIFQIFGKFPRFFAIFAPKRANLRRFWGYFGVLRSEASTANNVWLPMITRCLSVQRGKVTVLLVTSACSAAVSLCRERGRWLGCKITIRSIPPRFQRC
jgi:hypothetical protein